MPASNFRLSSLFLSIVSILLAGCMPEAEELEPATNVYRTQNVVVVVIDGPRYTETWGSPENIPYMSGPLAEQGTFFSNFRNEGRTYTLPGHTAITTGYYQMVNNDGTEIPLKPSLFQQYLEQTRQAPEKAYLLTSKDKLKVLSDCRDSQWRGRFNPAYSSGDYGNGRPDSLTLQKALSVLKTEQPRLMLVQFQGPDAEGHKGNYTGYLDAIRETDRLVYELWQAIQNDPHYSQQTALLVTNDHGRHADGHKSGFKDHGDGCEHCRHISLLALGPDFPQGQEVRAAYQQIDIAPTIAQLMQFRVATYGGQPIPVLTAHGEHRP